MQSWHKEIIIGEAVRAINDMTAQCLFIHYPAIPWRNIIGLRNIISHEYSNINYTMIVNIIKNNLNQLDDTIKQIINDLSTEG